MREHRRNSRGFVLIDSGDLEADFLADCARKIIDTGDRQLLSKLHLIELSPFQLVHYDPLRFYYSKTFHPEMAETIYRSWQHTKVQSYSENYQIKQGQSASFEGMPRVQRVFHNVFTAVTTLVQGKRLSVGNADLLIDVMHPLHHRVFDRIRPKLPREIVADFEWLHQMKSVRDFRQETESFLNRIRSFHGPLLKSMLSAGVNDSVFNLEKAIQNGDFVLVKVARSPFVSDDQNTALANMFIHDVAEIVEITSRAKRVPCTLIIDEAHKYVRPGIGELLRTSRKRKLSVVIATTDLVSLVKENVDLASEILAVVNTVIAFRMTGSDDVERMAKYLYSQNIDFTEMLQKVERHGGYEWLQIDESSESHTKMRGSASGLAISDGTVEGTATSRAHGAQKQSSFQTNPAGQVDGRGASNATSETRVDANNRSKSNTSQHTTTTNESESMGLTVNHKWVHLQRVIEEMVKTGKLERSVHDQFARFAQIIAGHSRRCASARVQEGKGFEFLTATVKDPFLSPEAQASAVDWIKRELYRTHDYYFTPSLNPSDELARIEEFLSGSAPNISVPEESRKKSPNVSKNRFI